MRILLFLLFLVISGPDIVAQAMSLPVLEQVQAPDIGSFQSSNPQLDPVFSKEVEGWYLAQSYDYQNALEAYLQALRIYEAEDRPIDAARVQARLGQVMTANGQYDLATQRFADAATVHLGPYQPWMLLWRAQLARAQGLLGRVKGDLELAIESFLEQEDYSAALLVVLDLAALEQDLGDWERAEQHFLMGEELARLMQDPHRQQQAALGLAQIALHLQDPSSSAYYAEQGLAVSPLDPVFAARLTLIQAVNRGTDLEAAMGPWEEKLISPNYLPGAEMYYAEKADVLINSGQLAKGIVSLKQQLRLKDSLWVYRQKQEVDRLMTRFASEMDVQAKENTIALLSAEKRQARLILVFLILLLLLSVGSLFLLWTKNRAKQRSNVELQKKNATIAKQRDQIAQQNNQLADLNERLVAEIADREYLEHSQEKNALYLASLSNEIRNPLQTIMSRTEEVIHTGQGLPAEGVTQVRTAGQEIMHYLNNLLDKARVESGQIVFQEEPFSPRTVLHDVRDRFADLASQRQVALHVDLDHSVPSTMQGDAIRLEQIISNLVRTVFQFEQLGEVTLGAEVRSGGTADTSVLEVAIHTDGEPVDPGMLKNVLSTADTPRVGVEGAYYNGHTGLLLSRRLIELQQGVVFVDTQPGSVSLRFCIEYRTVPDHAGDSQVEQGVLVGKRILVADDHRMNLLVINKILVDQGAEVTLCEDGLQAVEAFGQDSFDLVIMDLHMPELDGYRATQQLRKLTSDRSRPVPVLAVTASAYVDSSEKASLFAMDDYLGKPFTREALVRKVGRLLRQAEDI